MWAVPLILWVISLVLNVGPLFSHCTSSVSVQDLGCHLHWKCSDVTNTSTTFTVQTKIQGSEWQNVSHCVQISSYTCDLSQVFNCIENLVLYKYVKLGLSQGHGKIDWTQSSSHLCDPIKDPNASFSPPSLSLSLEKQQLRVEVIFPCTPYTVCQEEDEEDEASKEGDEKNTPTCCQLADFIFLNTTVVLNNTHDIRDVQTRSEVVDGSSLKLQFINLTPGHKYCAVARFASSPLSDPQCVHIPPLENTNLFVLALCGVFVALLLIAGFMLTWWCWCTSTDPRLPKSLISLQSQDQEGSVEDEPRQAAFEEEESFACISIISLNEVLPSEPKSVYLHLQSLRDRYYPTSILNDKICDGKEDRGYHSRDNETDDVADCASTADYPWPRWSSLPALRTGMVCLLGNLLTLECSRIPLSSVKVAGEQITKIESDYSFKVYPTIYNDED